MLKIIDKKKEIVKIIICFFLMMVWTVFIGLLEVIFEVNGLGLGMLAYLIPVLTLIIYVLKIEKAPISSIGLDKICFSDIPKGLLLGFCMFVVQQIPLIIIKMDYSVYAMPPDLGYIIVMSLYCILCVGLMEELVFRGFILQKTQMVCGSKIISIGINILFFYAIHWSSMQFTFGEFYNIAGNVLFLCVYFFKSKSKSIIPLIIAHGFYDILTSVLLPIFIFL